ncbi:S41 family peptidase [Pedobacter sp. SYP-B3415]|uniref:S41 family peptidase n=1 Tax=Pedobacter sp. SYP-B3415 TaxID=2496641 RepID=UPI0013EB1614|nr:S41 family peptidase [Pedobacter sp. SYP-B3415]
MRNSIKAVAANYSLFKTKVTRSNSYSYHAFNSVYLEKAQHVADSRSCQALMDEWVKFFNDRHLWVIVNPTGEKISYISKQLNLKIARSRWADKKIAKDSIEGLWEMEGYRAVIIPDKNIYGHFDALIVSSDNNVFKPGMLKMHLWKRDGFYEMDFYRRDSTVVRSAIRFTGRNTLIDNDDIAWRRMEPLSPGTPVPSLHELSVNDPYRPTLSWHDSVTAIFTLPSCAPRYAPVVDSVISQNREKLASCAYLVIDIRNNGGGSDRTYRALLPYMLSGPVVMPKVGYYMTEENVKLFRSTGILKSLNSKDTLQRDTMLTAVSSSPVTANTYHEKPVQVAILMGPQTASSGETFVLKTKASPRVRTYGQATAGCVDGFNGNVIDVGGATLRYPTSVRTVNLPEDAIDPFGILPDVPVSPHEPEPLRFVIGHMKTADANKLNR